MQKYKLIDAFGMFSTFCRNVAEYRTRFALLPLVRVLGRLNAEPEAIRAIIVMPNPSNELS